MLLVRGFQGLDIVALVEIVSLIVESKPSTCGELWGDGLLPRRGMPMPELCGKRLRWKIRTAVVKIRQI